MGSKGIRIKKNRGAIKKVFRTSPAITESVRERTQSIMDACNAQSSWGGYNSDIDLRRYRPVGRVWSIGKSDKPGGDRALRLVRNLDSGR